MILVTPIQHEEIQMAMRRIQLAQKELQDADIHLQSLMRIMGMDTSKLYNYDSLSQAYVEEEPQGEMTEVASS